MKIPSRCYVLASWIRRMFTRKHLYVTPSEILGYFFSPSPNAKGALYLDRMELVDDDRMVYLKGFDRPIYFPLQYSPHSILTGITEVCDPEDFHYYEIAETSVDANDVVVDCGAAEGFFTHIIAGRCRQVYAIEPLPEFAYCLSKTFQNTNNVTIIQSALSDTCGEVCFKESGIASIIADQGIRVRCETIDSLFHDKGIRIDYLKADIEGAESKMLAGAAKTISKYRPKLAITTYHIGNNELEIKNQIMEMCSEYKFRIKGMNVVGVPVLLHAWV